VRKYISGRFASASFTLMLMLVFSSTSWASVTITIQNNDPAGVGFNDATPVAPIGGNSGTTVGQQRLIAFQYAADIWGATLTSTPPITVRATWEPLTCTPTTAALGSAGATNVWRDFAGAPFTSTWFTSALANKLFGSDLQPGTAEIRARFNVNLGNTGCLDGIHWYYGLDNNHGNDVDLVTVLLHELSHGLGFQTFTDSDTGAEFDAGDGAGPLPTIYDRFLFDNTAMKTWLQMTNSERQASSINTGKLAWNGPQVTSDVHSVLGTPLLRVNSPGAIAGTYQVGTASFGPSLSNPGVTANVVQALDPSDASGTSTTDACSALTNAGAVAGKIALVDRGNCNFTVKVKNAQNTGALGVIVANNVAGGPPPMGGTDATITIPSVSITVTDGNTIKSQLASGVNATISVDVSIPSGTDQAGRALLYTPNPVDSGSSVSHWDTTAFPNQLMEPNITDDLSHSVVPPQDLTFSLLRDIGWLAAAPTPTPTPPAAVQFSSASYSVNEGATSLTVTVTRGGDTSGTASVDYKTTDSDTFTVGCSDTVSNLGGAYGRCDYATSVDTLTFAPGETSKTFSIPIIDDAFAEGNETFNLTLSNATGATMGSPSTASITINDNETVNGANPIFTTPFFVRQHYLDFLSREPEAGEPWSAVLNNCSDVNNNPACDRLTVSAAFFGSPEFQLKGYFVYRFYKLAFNRLPTYSEIVTDMRAVTGQTAAEVFQKKAAFTNGFVQRTEFANQYNSLTNAQYVTTLMGRYSLTQITTPDPAQPDGTQKVTLTTADLTNQLNSATLTRAQVLRAIADSDQVFSAEFNQAFVAMQYYGYLRRAPEQPGYNSWLNYLNANPSDFRTMVNGFMNSTEYRLRFGPP